MMELSATATRALACLIEKDITTPDAYPLTLNALRNACNQKSNREPVVDYDEKTVVKALDELRENKLAWMVRSSGSRVPKYDHRMEEAFDLAAGQQAVLCVLMLRGPQTVGELKSRSSRMHDFATVAEVEVALHKLESREQGSLVVELPLQRGAREPRYMHLLSGEPSEYLTEPDVPEEPARQQVREDEQRMEALTEEVQELRNELTALREAFDTFKAQFE